MTATDDGDVAARVARRYAREPVWKTAAYTAALAIGVAGSDWLMGHPPRPRAIAIWIVISFAVYAAASGWRARGGPDATLRRALEQAKPCARCGRTVLAWEGACPNCGPREALSGTGQWMPIVIVVLGAAMWLALIALLAGR